MAEADEELPAEKAPEEAPQPPAEEEVPRPANPHTWACKGRLRVCIG